MDSERGETVRLLGSIAIILGTGLLSFFIGMRYQKITAGATSSGIQFSCDPNMLSTLEIPKGSGSAGGSVAGANVTLAPTTGSYFGSRNGTKYYGASCGKGRIKPENLIWFTTSEEAEIQGYTRSSSC